MSDVVVTVPKNFRLDDDDPQIAKLRGLAAWIAEGDAATSANEEAIWSGGEWCFSLGGNPPNIKEGERVYIVCEGKLRGYAPLLYVDDLGYGRYGLIRGGGAVAVTIDEPIRGFQGWRYRWWRYDQERPFPNWQTP
jgi:hypothetical protein